MTEAMYTTDCRNGHHGERCGMTPCRCECHQSRRPAPAPHAEERDRG